MLVSLCSRDDITYKYRELRVRGTRVIFGYTNTRTHAHTYTVIYIQIIHLLTLKYTAHLYTKNKTNKITHTQIHKYTFGRPRATETEEKSTQWALYSHGLLTIYNAYKFINTINLTY